MTSSARRAEAVQRWLLSAVVALAVLACFAPVLGNAFVAWDDGSYIQDNPWIRGLGPANLRWMLTASRGMLWQPLTWLSLAVDYRLWGLDPWAFHAMNVFLHAATALLFFAVCRRLYLLAEPSLSSENAAWAAALAALFFAVHPLRVESVAWATERKDVLSGALWLAALLAYLESARRGRGWLIGAAVLFACAVAAKATVVMLPPVLVVLEIYPLRRLPADPRRWLGAPYRELWLRLAPFFAVSAAGALAELAASKSTGVLEGLSAWGPSARFAQVGYGLLFYPIKTLLPSGLAALYFPPRWFSRWSPQLLLLLAAAAAAAVAVWRLALRSRAIGAAAAAYVLVLLPVSGLVQAGMAYRACDRYSYLPCLPFAVLFGAALGRRSVGARALAGAWLVALGVGTRAQCAVWSDTLTLWRSCAERAPSAFALSKVGLTLCEAGRNAEGVGWLERAVAEFPDQPVGYANLGVGLCRVGRPNEAAKVLRRGLAVEAMPETHAELGTVLARGGPEELAEGLLHLRTAVTLRPGEAPWRLEYADALARAGNSAEAERQYAAALALDPNLGRAQNNWGLLLARQGREDAAVVHYRAALRIQDARAEANYNWGNVLLERGELAGAERHYREALRLEPELAGAQVNLGNVLVRRGRFEEALERYRLALKKDPGLSEARANLAAVRRALGR